MHPTRIYHGTYAALPRLALVVAFAVTVKEGDLGGAISVTLYK